MKSQCAIESAATFTDLAQKFALIKAAENVVKVFQGDLPSHPVNPEVWSA